MNSTENDLPSYSFFKQFIRVSRYLGGKLLAIGITIFIAVFTQRGLGPPESPFEKSLIAQIDLVIRQSINDGTIPLNEFGVPDQVQLGAYIQHLRDDLGLNQPYIQKY